MVGQIQSWFCMSTEGFAINFIKTRIVKLKGFIKIFSRTDSRRIPNFEKKMSSFISSCYWFRAIPARTHSNSQRVRRSSRKWRNIIRWFICRPWVYPLRRTYGSIQIKDFKNLLYICVSVSLYLSRKKKFEVCREKKKKKKKNSA